LRALCFALATLLIVAMTSGCPSFDSNAVNDATSVIDYGNGLYYFSSTGADFGNELSKFIGDHPELELVAMCGDGTGGNSHNPRGYDKGYWVYFHQPVDMATTDALPDSAQ